MDKSYIDYFGRKFMETVRDRTIMGFKRVVSKRVVGDTGERYQDLMKDFSEEQIKIITENIVPDLVDKCMFEMLRFFDTSEDIEILVKGENASKELNSIEKNLASLMMDKNGWKDLYSKNK